MSEASEKYKKSHNSLFVLDTCFKYGEKIGPLRIRFEEYSSSIVSTTTAADEVRDT